VEFTKQVTSDVLWTGEPIRMKSYVVVSKKTNGGGGGGRELAIGEVRSKKLDALRSPICHTPNFCCIVGWSTQREAKAFAIALLSVFPYATLADGLRDARQEAQDHWDEL
jgi:hypothetical protein